MERRTGTARIAIPVVVILVAILLATCGGGGLPPSATVLPGYTALATGIPMPSGLTEAQREAAVTIPDPGDASKPLAHLIGSRELGADELAKEIEEDAAFAALENDAVSRGFGRMIAAADFVYDNGVTVTAAELEGFGDGVFRFAFRSSAPRPHYLLVEIDREGQRLTAHDANGTISFDLTTGESTGVESPTAHHSCSFLHCFQTALWICMDIPVYGALVGTVCEGCIALISSGVGSPLGAPACLTCISTAVATLGASAWVCDDDPCGYCHSDSCGTAEPASEDHCAWFVAPADPVTGYTSGIARVNYGYSCNGISGPAWDRSYERTQCQQWSASGGLVTPCPYGCASPPPGGTASIACMPSPSVCDPSTCTGETAIGVPACVLRPDDGKHVVTRQYEVRGCVPAANGETCGTTTETRVVEVCPGDCSDDGQTCEVPRCDPATCTREEPEGPQVCTDRRVVQPTRQYYCNATRTACESRVYDKPVQVCTAGCAADGQHCAGPGGGRTDVYTVTGNVWEAVSPDAYARCLRCTIRLTGDEGVYTTMSGTDGGYTIADVPSGTYRVERECGTTWVAAHGPWDAALGYAAVTVPTTGSVNVEVPKCEQ